MNGTETIAEAGPYPYTSPHDGQPLIGYAALFHRPAGSGRPAPGAPGAGRPPRIASTPITVSPAPPTPAPASTRPSPPCAKATRWSCRNSTGWQGPSRMPAPSPIGFGNEGVKLALGRALYDPGHPMGKMFFNILATFAEFETDLIRMRTREGMAIARARGRIARQAAQTVRPTAAGTLPHACHGRVFHQRSRRTLLRLKTNRLSHTQPTPFPLAYDPAPTGIDPRVGGTFPARRKIAPPPIASAAPRRCAVRCVSPLPPRLPTGLAPQWQSAFPV